MSLYGHGPGGYIEDDRAVSPSALISFDGNSYSVPPAFIGQEVKIRLRVGADSFEVLSPTGAVIASHRRTAKGSTTTGKYKEKPMTKPSVYQQLRTHLS